MGTLPHYITEITPGSMPRRIVALCVRGEDSYGRGWSRDGAHIIMDWCARGMAVDRQGRSKHFRAHGSSARSLWEFIASSTRRKDTTWIVADNLPRALRLIQMGHYAQRGIVSIRSWSISGRCVVMAIDGGAGRSIWVDRVNYGMAPIDAAKAPEDICDTILVDIIGLAGYLVDSGSPQWSATASGIAWRVWRQSYLAGRPHVHGNNRASSLERLSYFGGRMDCWRLGRVNGSVYKLDVNALYPACASYVRLPCQLHELGAGDIHQIRAAVRAGEGVIASVALRAQSDYPWRAEGGKVHHQRGSYWTVLAAPELCRAIMRDEVAQVSTVATYRLGEPLKDILLSLYRTRVGARNDGLTALAAATKAMANGLIGRFAAHAYEWRARAGVKPASHYGDWHALQPGGGQPRHYRYLGTHVEEELRMGEGEHSMVALASYVTSFARVYMQKLIDIAGQDNVIYQANDSLHVTEAGFAALQERGIINPDQIGSLKLEGVYDGCTYHSPAKYSWGAALNVPSHATGGGHSRAGANNSGRRPGELGGQCGVPLGGGLAETGRGSAGRVKYADRVSPDGRISPREYHEPL